MDIAVWEADSPFTIPMEFHPIFSEVNGYIGRLTHTDDLVGTTRLTLTASYLAKFGLPVGGYLDTAVDVGGSGGKYQLTIRVTRIA